MSDRGGLRARDPGEWDQLRYAAEMEARQLRAIEERLSKETLVEEIKTVDRVLDPRLGKRADRDTIRRWLRNGWNTERLLHRTSEEFGDDALSAALQWAFPMAYYSVFATTCAFFETAGFTEKSHASTLKKFGELALRGDLPECVSFALIGTKKHLEFHRIKRPEGGESTITFDPDDPRSVAKHICQFLRSTRLQELKDKASEMRFTTVKGERRKRLNEEHWEQVDRKIGATTILNLLYRKRIKANYRDIDSFADAGVDVPPIHESLLHIVSCLNFMWEVIIAAALGLEDYEVLVEDFLTADEREFLTRRLEVVTSIISA